MTGTFLPCAKRSSIHLRMVPESKSWCNQTLRPSIVEKHRHWGSGTRKLQGGRSTRPGAKSCLWRFDHVIFGGIAKPHKSEDGVGNG